MQKDLRRLISDPNLIPPEKQDLLARVATQASSLDMACYLVGGAVRDLYLERLVNDFDIVVEGDAIALGNALVEKFGGKLSVHSRFLTATWVYNEAHSLDLITARTEIYESPGRLPMVKPSTVEDDLHRRDFTINAMALRLDGEHFGELLDPLNGQKDVEEGTIRALHLNSFFDDPTRIFRAIRYEQRFGFRIEPDTLKLINREVLAVLSKLSGERIRHELDLVFAEDKPAAMLLRLSELGIFGSFEPALPKLNEKYIRLFDSNPADELGLLNNLILLGHLLWLIDSSSEQIISLSKHLEFTTELKEAVIAAIQLKDGLPELKNSKPSAWTLRLDRVPLLAVYATWLVTSEPALREFLAKWRHVRPQTTGDDLKALGIPAGPRYKEILAHLRAAWLDGHVTSSEDENSLLKKLVDSDKAP